MHIWWHTTRKFNWILMRQRWFSSLLKTTRKACLSLSLSIWMELRFIFLLLSAAWVSPLNKISLFLAACLPHLSNLLSLISSRINSIHHCLSQNAFKTLISAVVPSRIDVLQFSTCWLSLATHSQTSKSLTLQGSSVESLSLIISSILHTLHWLPIEWRIEDNVLLAFKSVNNKGPSYLHDLLKFYIPSQ